MILRVGKGKAEPWDKPTRRGRLCSSVDQGECFGRDHQDLVR